MGGNLQLSNWMEGDKIPNNLNQFDAHVLYGWPHGYLDGRKTSLAYRMKKKE